MLCAKCIYFLCSLQLAYVHSFHPVQPTIIEHVTSTAATSKTSIKYKLLSVQEKLDIIRMVDAT